MELRQLETFVTVARLASFTRAAEQLHLTQPAVTRQIAALERELRTRLLDRLGKTVRLTASGEALHGYALSLLQLEDDARQAVAAVEEGRSGRLAVGASTTLATYLLPDVLTAFRQRLPEVEVVVRTGTSAHILALVREGSVDIGWVTTGGESDTAAGLVIEPLRAYQTVLVVPPGHPLAGRTAVAPAELAGEPLLLMEEGTNLRSYTARILSASGIATEAAMELDSVETIKRMVAAGLGSSLLPQVAVAAEVAAGQVVALPITAPQGERGIALAYRATKYRTIALEALLTLLRVA